MWTSSVAGICDLVCEFLHILESCSDPGQLTSTVVNVSLVSQVACAFKVGFPFRLIYSSPWRFGFRIPICVQSITPIAVGNIYMLCHIRLASISSWLGVGNLIHSFDCATMLFITLSTVRDTVA
ncbi:unnamed protein product [Acanthoscelides obtectus]|uniref:Uncharacterized protein n=1 Tax=Acanthoscelides obtectus TaxID=200917 RepID=A0A9P0KHG6_ACAOB|nr:unnamed protein product [Acanthoscelides obtectus]CAK1669352.1 hypothetical protein AOBTE_LOCUS26969 [Acanthoscelides obtectus]